MKQYKYTALEKRQKLKPLVRFDSELIKNPLAGILINIDRDLERRAHLADLHRQAELHRQITLMHVMIRIAKNSWEALAFLQSDVDEHAKRKASFALVAPPVNRQLIDLLFTLIYIRDDFGPRSLAYERAGWRAFKEHYDRLYARFGDLREWKRYITEHKRLLNVMGKLVRITRAAKLSPARIKRWKGPFYLSHEDTASKAFLQWMVKWIYDDISAEAHLTGIGLFMLSPFLLADMTRFRPDSCRKSEGVFS